ncbi:unnamed protein product [Effrenium voratum]|nr:unnamed protein product [Effrenium voratum]
MRASLPPHILNLYDAEAEKKSSPRAFRTQVINKLFKKLDNGRYELQTEAPMFTEAKRLYAKKCGQDENRAMPRSTMAGLYFHNDINALDKALKAGEIYTTTGDDNKEYFAFRELVTGTEHGTEETQSISKTKKVSKEQSRLLENVLRQLDWKFERKDEAKMEASLQQGSLPKNMASLVKQALDAISRLLADATKCFKKAP